MSLASVSQPLQGYNLYITKRATSSILGNSQKFIIFESLDGAVDGVSDTEQSEGKDLPEISEYLESVKLPAISSAVSPSPSPELQGHTRVGHKILSERDKASQNHFRSEIRHSQHLSPAVQQQAVASSFEKRKGLTRHTFEVEGNKERASTAGARIHASASSVSPQRPSRSAGASPTPSIKSSPQRSPPPY